jgi:hypothetical protein
MFILEIIALVFLCRKNGNLAMQKGLRPTPWKWYTVIAWIVAEMIGIMIGMSFYGQMELIRENILGISFFGLVCAVGGYLLIKFLLERKADYKEEVKRVGSDDLHPPRNQ